jgi:predicted nucleic acid-binding protein
MNERTQLREHTVLIDTDVLSFNIKGDSRASLYEDAIRHKVSTICFMTLAEIERWIIEAKMGERRRVDIETKLRPYALLPFHRGICATWANVMAESRRKGRPISVPDAWIAASALFFDVPLITHNSRHYSHVDGLYVLTAEASP